MAWISRSAMLAASLAVLMASPGAMAQSTDQTGATAEELQLLFKRQKSRGLKLAPNTAIAPTTKVDPVATATATTDTTAVADVPTETEGTAVATVEPAAAEPATDPGTAVAVAVTPEEATAATETAKVAYQELDKADQINFRIGFDFDSAVLRESEKAKLTSLCTAMKAVDVQLFRIVGHTDAAGTEAYNEKLSLLRAEEVKRHLVSVCGIEASRLQAVGVGKRFLFNSDNPRSEENRRVEFQALS